MTRRNPLYQALLRTGLIHRLMRDLEKAPGTKALFDQFHNEMSVLRNLCDRGVIPAEVRNEIRLAAARSIHAAAINHWRKQARLIDRRRMPRMLRESVAHSVRW
ncbi:hypothetical protein ACLE20_13270 [Rhizobium sp. YIM 134829]|uniref:hypothetical protein n=1 Tax=Rhizobium sp. YIM 134829 TaxID=3390453 RepID=UPI003979BC20